MARRVIGLDLGAYSVKLVRLECGKQAPKFEIIDAIEEILQLPEEGEPNLVEQQKDAVRRLFDMGLMEAETFAIGLEAAGGQMRTMKVPFTDSRKIEAVLPGLLEAEVPFELDDMIVSWHRVEGAPAQPVEGEAEGAFVRIGFGKKPLIAQTLQMLQTFPIDPRHMHLAPVAPYELVRELGFDTFYYQDPATIEENSLAAIIDFGHRSCSVCIFDKHGLRTSRSFMRGGKHLTEEIAGALSISFKEAEQLKHDVLDLGASGEDDQSKIINALGQKHYQLLREEITRMFIATSSSGVGQVRSVAFIGGASKTKNCSEFFFGEFQELGIVMVPTTNFLPARMASPSFAIAFSYALSCLQIHAKDSRFNFRKDEFAWRGELDFLRTKSTPLILWTLTLVASLVVLWSASSLVLEKENNALETQLKQVCTEILGQKNVAPRKCLTLMKEQISANTDVGIPEITATDIYIKVAEFLPKDIKVTVSELDVTKKIRITGETGSFENIDKIVASLGQVPCVTNIEKGRAQQGDKNVKFVISSDFECNPLTKPTKTAPQAKP